MTYTKDTIITWHCDVGHGDGRGGEFTLEEHDIRPDKGSLTNSMIEKLLDQAVFDEMASAGVEWSWAVKDG